MRNWPGICWCFPPLTTLPATAEPQWHVKIVTYGLMFWPLSGTLFGMWNWPDIRWCFSPLTTLPVTAEPQWHVKIVTYGLMFLTTSRHLFGMWNWPGISWWWPRNPGTNSIRLYLQCKKKIKGYFSHFWHYFPLETPAIPSNSQQSSIFPKFAFYKQTIIIITFFSS